MMEKLILKSKVLIPIVGAMLLLPACHQAPPAPSATSIAQGATLTVQPRFARRIAEVGLHSRASIGHVLIDVLRVEGGLEVPSAQATVTAGELDHAIQFQNLRFNTTYKLRARAYHLDGSLISDDAASTATVVIGSVAPAIAALQVKLVDLPYPTVSTGASLSGPTGIAHGADGALYVVRGLSDRAVIKIADGTITSLAEGLNEPYGLAVDSLGTVYVSERANHRIWRIPSGGTPEVFAGSGSVGAADGTGTEASFNSPYGLALDSQGRLYVADGNNGLIRMISSSGVVTTLAGSGSQGFADGTGANASFNYPNGVAVDGQGQVYVADSSNHRVRKITPEGVVTTLADSSSLSWPMDVEVDSVGNVFVVDQGHHRICKIAPDGDVTTIAGTNSTGYVDGNGFLARFNLPEAMALGTDGRLYVSDYLNDKIRVIE